MYQRRRDIHAPGGPSGGKNKPQSAAHEHPSKQGGKQRIRSHNRCCRRPLKKSQHIAGNVGNSCAVQACRRKAQSKISESQHKQRCVHHKRDDAHRQPESTLQQHGNAGDTAGGDTRRQIKQIYREGKYRATRRRKQYSLPSTHTLCPHSRKNYGHGIYFVV